MGKRKTQNLAIRLTAEQRRELDEAASDDELDTSTWLRQLGLLEARARRDAPARMKRIREALRRLDATPERDG